MPKKIHYGKIIENMVALTGRTVREIASEAGYSYQDYYRTIKKKDISTKVIESYARACKRKVEIKVV